MVAMDYGPGQGVGNVWIKGRLEAKNYITLDEINKAVNPRLVMVKLFTLKLSATTDTVRLMKLLSWSAPLKVIYLCSGNWYYTRCFMSRKPSLY